MANDLPTPRSYQEIVSEVLTTIAATYGLQNPKIGGPLISLVEAAAQSDFRNSKDIFDLLNALDLDRCNGDLLDYHAATNRLYRIAASNASTIVNISDTSFTKIASILSLGGTAVGAGVTKITLADAGSFGSSGQVYIGRGTTNYEGPISYTKSGNILTLTSPTQNPHNLGEVVTFAQGGDRVIPSGTTISTVQTHATGQAIFSTTESVTLLDGETEIQNVAVACTTPGIIGNVGRGSLVTFSSPPFTGASVTNPRPVTNGTEIESDDNLRERIKSYRRAERSSTDLSLKINSLGIRASDEDKIVTDASIFSAPDEPTSLIIDDGSGYEELNYGVVSETLTNVAIGGEKYFTLKTIPVVKAFAETALEAPFLLSDGAVLSVYVGGVLSEHTFDDIYFKDISQATAYEVISSINGNPNIAFSARLSGGASKVCIFAKSETNDDIQVTSSSGVDANNYLGFPTNLIHTVKLYKNDVLLHKDGQKAVLKSNSQYQWGSISSGVEFIVSVDGTKTITYTITDNDFVTYRTGYNLVNKDNSLTAWATVLGKIIPGITATVENDYLVLTSNLGANENASLEIFSCGLVSSGMFNIGVSQGKSADYFLNRSTGQIKLAVALEAGDKLKAGTELSEACLISNLCSNGTVTLSSDGYYWILFDYPVEQINYSTCATAAITVNSASPEYKITFSTVGALSNVQDGDWMVIYGNSPYRAYKIKKDVTNTIAYFSSLETLAGLPTITITSPNTKLAFFRTNGQIQNFSIIPGTSTLQSIASTINGLVVGGRAIVYRNKYLKLLSNSLENGSVILLADNGQALQFSPKLELAISSDSHTASVVADNSDIGTPTYLSGVSAVNTSENRRLFASVDASTATTATSNSNGLANKLPTNEFSYLYWLSNNTASKGFGTLTGNKNFVKSIAVVTTDDHQVTFNETNNLFVTNTKFTGVLPYAIGAYDTLDVVFDKQSSSKSVKIPFYRNIKSAVQFYLNSFNILDVDNGDNTSMEVAFGTGYDFKNWNVFMKPRCVSHYGGGAGKAILWRYGLFGAHEISIEYVNPTAPNQSDYGFSTEILLNNENSGDYHSRIKIRLKSDAETTIANMSNNGVFLWERSGGPTYTYRFKAYTKTGTSISRTSNVVTITYASDTNVPVCIAQNDLVYITSSDINFGSGYKTVISVSSTALTYAETGVDIGASPGTYVISPWGASAPDFTGHSGKVVTMSNLTTSATQTKTFRITGVGASSGLNYFEVKSLENWGAAVGAYKVENTSNIKFYPILAKTANDLVAWVNAEDNVKDILNGTTIKDHASTAKGTGTISVATFDEYLAGTLNSYGSPSLVSVPYWTLKDGQNSVQTLTTTAGVSTLNFKVTVSPELVRVSNVNETDFTEESIRICPATTSSIVNYINNPASGVFYINGEAVESNGKVQLKTKTQGSAGAIQVTGGTANLASATISTSGLIKTSSPYYMYVGIDKSLANGFVPGNYVTLSTPSKQPKSYLFESGDSYSFTQGSVNTKLEKTLGSGNLKTRISNVSITNPDIVQIYKLSPKYSLWYFSSPLNSNITEGCWVRSKINDVVQYKKIEAIYKETDGDIHGYVLSEIDEPVDYRTVTDSTFNFFTYDSIVPGDVLYSNSTAMGLSGQYTVVDDESSLGYNSTIYLQGIVGPTSPVTLLIKDNSYFLEKEPISLTKKIVSVKLSNEDSTKANVILHSNILQEKVNPNIGFTITAKDKLAFESTVKVGYDSYHFAGGLVSAVHKVVYGDSTNPNAYPGLVASGSKVNIQGPIIKRITLGLSVRLRSSLSETDILNQIRNIIAGFINGQKLGVSIAISDLIAEASSVEGVVSIVVNSPAYSLSNDLIKVQANEKPMILDLENDIVIKIMGE